MGGAIHQDRDNLCSLSKFLAAPNPNRYVYAYFIKEQSCIPSAVNKWQNKIINTTLDWPTIFTIPFKTLIAPKIRYFQYRFLHRILGVNSYIYKFKYVNSPLCTFCNTSDETIEHLFWDCDVIQTFWNTTNMLCLNPNKIQLINKINVFFGSTEKGNSPLNSYIFFVKYFIFCSKLDRREPDSTIFCRKFDFFLKVNDHICSSKAEKSNNFNIFFNTTEAMNEH